VTELLFYRFAGRKTGYTLHCRQWQTSEFLV